MKLELASLGLLWTEADAYAELSQRGWTVRAIAEACKTNIKTVSIFTRASLRYRNTDERPSFWHAYQSIEPKAAAHVAQNTGRSGGSGHRRTSDPTRRLWLDCETCPPGEPP